MVARVHPGPAGNRQIRTCRQGSPPWSREVLGAASAGVITRGCPAVHWHIDFLVALPSAQDLLLCAKHLFVAAMVAWVHPGPAANRQIRRQRGSPLRSREVFRAAKAKRRRHYPWLTRRSLANRRLTLALRRTCCAAPNTCSSLLWWLGFIPGLLRIGKSEDRGAVRVGSGFRGRAPPSSPAGALLPPVLQSRCQFFPAGGRMNLRRRLQPLVLSRAGLQSERPKGACPPSNHVSETR
jgi:hypothetical protein